MSKIKLTIPVAPSINHCYFYINGKKVKGAKAKQFEQEVALIMRDINFKFDDKRKIVCKMWYFFPDNRRRDTHNTLKLLLDSIERGGLYSDDRYVLPQIMDWQVDKENPIVEMEFEYKEE